LALIVISPPRAVGWGVLHNYVVKDLTIEHQYQQTDRQASHTRDTCKRGTTFYE
jgi:hypothetical protein